MKKLLSLLTLLTVALTATAQITNTIVIDRSSFRAVQKDALTGANVDPIGVDHSRRACARLKIFFHKMTREQLAQLDAIFPSGTIEKTKIKVADYENVLILEMTAKPQVAFYLKHPTFGTSNEVTLSLEGNKEYQIEATLNQTFSIVVNSNVEGAEVYLDGVFKGQTNSNFLCTIADVMIGEHSLKVVYGKVSGEKNIEVNKNSIFFTQNIDQNVTEVNTYKVGDYYNDGVKEGVVFEVSADGRRGKIVSMKQSSERLQWSSDSAEQRRLIGADSKTDGAYNMAKVKAVSGWRDKYPAFKWCADLGEGWYLPSIEELEVFTLNTAIHDAVNRTLIARGGTKLYDIYENGWYWSSTEHDYKSFVGFCAWYVVMFGGSTNDYFKFNDYYVRAVSAFGDSSKSESVATTSAPYKVGDYYNENGKRGVVFEVSADGRHGKIVSMKQSKKELQWSSNNAEQNRLIGADSETDGAANMAKVKAISGWRDKYPAFKWCADLGKGWYLPSIGELKVFTLNTAIHDAVNRTLKAKGGEAIHNKGDLYKWYWSSTEENKQYYGEFCARLVLLYDGSTRISFKYSNGSVRAVSAF